MAVWTTDTSLNFSTIQTTTNTGGLQMQNIVAIVEHNLMVAIESCTGMCFQKIGGFNGWNILIKAIRNQEEATPRFGGLLLNWNPKKWELTFSDKRGLFKPNMLTDKFKQEVFVTEPDRRGGTWVFSFVTHQIKYLKSLGIEEEQIDKAA